jgi:hypothetical protein
MRRNALGVLISALFGAATVALVTTPASAGRDPLLVANPNPALVNENIIVQPESEACPDTGVFITYVDSEDNFVSDSFVDLDDEDPSDDLWTDTVSFAEPGSYFAHAVCGVDLAGDFSVQFFEYTPLEIVVHAPSVFTFNTAPSSGPVGTTVSVDGAFCAPGLGDAVVVTFTLPDPAPVFDPGTTDVTAAFTVGPPDASYAGTFAVPDVTAGDYQINGFCVTEGGTPIAGPIIHPFEVTPGTTPPAPPVDQEPDFTG